MTSVSISILKARPSATIKKAQEYPVAVQKRNLTQAYLIGSELYEKLLSYIEDYVDRKVVDSTDFGKGKDFDKIANELGI